MHVRQVTLTFVPEQDRLLMRVNSPQGEEFRVWFTRRLLLALLPHWRRGAGWSEPSDATQSASHADHAHAAMTQMVQQFQREATLQQADFSTPFADQPSALPLGAEPLLVTHAKLTPSSDGRVDLCLEECLPGSNASRSFVATLEPQVQIGLLHLIDKTLAACEWAVSPALPGEAGQTASDASTGAERPRYLN